MPTALIAALLLSVQGAPAAGTAEPGRVLPQGVIELHVADLHCQGCAKRLARKLYATPGVKRVRTYVKKDLAIIELQPKKQVELAKLWSAAIAAKQEPVTMLVLDKKLVAADFEETLKAAGLPTKPEGKRVH